MGYNMAIHIDTDWTNRTDIDDFLNYYEYGIFFHEIDINKVYEVNTNNTRYLYLLCCKNKIVYVGQTSCLTQRLGIHRNSLEIEKTYIAEFPYVNEKQYTDIDTEEQCIISYVNPVLNNKWFTLFESMGLRLNIDGVLGFGKCIELLRQSNNKSVKGFIKQLSKRIK